jgi:NAD(P)-dependent dehydrogenase (short-subunit alcohol dehydrogenase family)
MRFRDKVALISGAGSGIGRATAQMIGAEGGTVVGVDLDQTSVEQIMDGIRRAGGKAHALVANVLAAADVARVVQQTIETCGRIDILVNAVGGSTIISNSGATVDALTLDEWQNLLTFNLMAPFSYAMPSCPS